MIPSILAHEVRSALAGYVKWGFEPSNSPLQKLMKEFLKDPDALAKGPYVELSLPFLKSSDRSQVFGSVPMEQTPFLHQERAFARLRQDVLKSTLITTGTGSGKTECFMYPILDYCASHADERGIKALIVYPMNALATDQAERFAGKVASSPALNNKVTVGLYTGDSSDERKVMTAHHVIEDRHKLRSQPPDILLTNYKMLDLLLMRPDDVALWSENGPMTLRFLVVDELHTFDGAQGTDLACLVRRLKKARGTPASHLVCIGTSATMGSQTDMIQSESSSELVEFAKQIFGEPFEDDSIITEKRLTVEELIGSKTIEYTLSLPGDTDAIVDPNTYADADEYIDKQYELFFGEMLDRSNDGWEQELGAKLLRHSTFRLFLKSATDTEACFKTIADLAQELQPTLPSIDCKTSYHLINSLCALISTARSKVVESTQLLSPFLNIRLHLWVRELRRMVASTPAIPPSAGRTNQSSSNNENHNQESEPLEDESENRTAKIRFSDDLKADEDSVHFPLIQCRECLATGWAALRPASSERYSANLDSFYNAFFGPDARSKIHLLFPCVDGEAHPKGMEINLCRGCGRKNPLISDPTKREPCSACGDGRITRLQELPLERRSSEHNAYDCPFCNAEDGLILFGAQISTQMSILLSQIYGSSYNDDRKTVLFSDNVQDASHRASFVGARTWRDLLTSSILRAIPSSGSISLEELAEGIDSQLREYSEGPSRTAEINKFICDFLPPDRLYLRDFRYLQEHGSLPSKVEGEPLPQLLKRRLRWEVKAQFSYESLYRRSLEKNHAVAVTPNLDLLERAGGTICTKLFEELNLRKIELKTVISFLLGLLRVMRLSGAVTFNEKRLNDALGNSGARFRLSRDIALRDFGPSSAAPCFPSLTNKANRQFFEYAIGPNSKYLRWLQICLLADEQLTKNIERDALRLVFDELSEVGLLTRVPTVESDAFAIDSRHLRVTREVEVLEPPSNGSTIPVSEDEKYKWERVPNSDFSKLSGKPVTKDSSASFNSLREFYKRANPVRVHPAEHTALVSRERKSKIQEQFTSKTPQPWYPNLISATPTLELGVDIGDLSTAMMCTMPPAPTNYVQRVGRTGRRTGNSLALAMASGRSHDLYFFEEPEEMLAAKLSTPGLYLDALAVLRRQLAAFCLDQWVVSGELNVAIPRTLGQILARFDPLNRTKFPGNFLRYIEVHGSDLFRDFCSLFTDDEIKPETRNKLNPYVLRLPGYASESIHRALVEVFDSVAADLRNAANDIQTKQRELSKLQKLPSDEKLKEQINVLSRDINGLRRMGMEIRARTTLVFLTEEGILPNYAFPESGIKLRSLIFSQPSEDQEATGPEVRTFEYLRPASVALNDFAPNQWFYAESRRVQVHRVDVSEDALQTWRQCPVCDYLEEESSEDRNACPKCGNSQFADVGSKVRMLKLNRVHAHSTDRTSQIMDDREYREPTFFMRRLLSHFDEEAEKSWVTKDFLFGLEFFSSVTFRDINMGTIDDSFMLGSRTGKGEAQGFQICGKCGVVADENGGFNHARQCTINQSDPTEKCLYLYREFKSEAMRVILGFDEAALQDVEGASLIAALELGLRKHFKGQVGHLRFLVSPIPMNNKQLRMCLVLYDIVPGGTGYINEFIGDKNKFERLLNETLEALNSCVCVDDPLKDGCYRCVYHYYRQHDLEKTSRRTAARMVELLLAQTQELAESDQSIRFPKEPLVLKGVAIEKLFLDCMRRQTVDGNPTLVNETIDVGQRSWTVRAGKCTYSMREEVSLNESSGVSRPCRPDFLLTPHPDQTGNREIAVFLDGFTYHKDTSARDSSIRMGLQRDGFLVWSFSYGELKQIAQENEAEKAEGSLNPLVSRSGVSEGIRTVQSKLDESWNIGHHRRILKGNSMELFVGYLHSPDDEKWRKAVFAELLGLINVEERNIASEDDRIRSLRELLPQFEQVTLDLELPSQLFLGATQLRDQYDEVLASLHVALDPKALSGEVNPDGLMVIVHENDDRECEEQEWRAAWNTVLCTWNQIQFLHFSWWTTQRGLKQLEYESLRPLGLPSTRVDGYEWPPDWKNIADYSVVAEATLLDLSNRGLPCPEVGWELVNEEGFVIAEAELAWVDEKLAVLHGNQQGSETATEFDARSWKILDIDDEGLSEQISTFLKKE